MACIDRLQTTSAWLHFLFCDVLSHVCFLSQLFQRESIDLAELGKAVNTTLCLLLPYQSDCNPDGYLTTLDKQLDTVDGALKYYCIALIFRRSKFSRIAVFLISLK